ncbi:SAF domain-containing protein [Actinomycetospora callitridis]|uniref:SAF domain-containing protein n=1 Tax=Actinomycetospora callitridis TaxID=913944 RepID=UPI0023652B55|nr:SAF domain-containing protein [Actinomycetospora callitridis]MDD7916477.1 SAF domain-containing protein [Actinomycetospora callitridis]
MADETRQGPRRWRLPPPGWRRTVALRRAAAGLLVVLALGLLAAPSVAPAGTPVLVAARDLAPGVALGPADVAVRLLPGELVPAGAFAEPGAVAGRQVVGGVRAGEALTDVRLLGPVAAVAAAGVPDAAGVPVRLADAGVAALLTPGTRVDLVAAGADDAGAVAADPALLAPGAVVLAVLPAPERTAGSAPVVVVALPAALAARVATVSLREEVTVTLR